MDGPLGWRAAAGDLRLDPGGLLWFWRRRDQDQDQERELVLIGPLDAIEDGQVDPALTADLAALRDLWEDAGRADLRAEAEAGYRAGQPAWIWL